MVKLQRLLSECVEKGVIADATKIQILAIQDQRRENNVSIFVDALSTISLLVSFIVLMSLTEDWRIMIGTSITSLVAIISLQVIVLATSNLLAPHIVRAFISGSIICSLLLGLDIKIDELNLLAVSCGSLLSLMHSQKHHNSKFLDFVLSANIFVTGGFVFSLALSQVDYGSLYGFMGASVLGFAHSFINSKSRLHDPLRLICVTALIATYSIFIVTRIDSAWLQIALWLFMVMVGFTLRSKSLQLQSNAPLAFIICGSMGITGELVETAIDLDYGKIIIAPTLALAGLVAILLHKRYQQHHILNK